MPAVAAGQPDEAGMSTDPGAADPLVARVFHIREIPSWAEPFSNYLIIGDLPKAEAEARRLQRRAQAYTIINSKLYKAQRVCHDPDFSRFKNFIMHLWHIAFQRPFPKF
jgi:hypothetical protein